MNLLHLLYNLIGTTAGLASIPPAWLYHRKSKEDLDRLHQRLGWYTPDMRKGFHGRPRVWLHAVSVGEVGVAETIVKALRDQLPACRVAVSTTTKQGLARAKAHFADSVPCFYAPVDLIGPACKALRMVQPDVLALLETEIWPNLIIRARRMGVRIVVLNGRISVRTIKSYLKIRPLMRHTLSHINTFSMISPSDAKRIQSLGADKQRILVNGNAKFDFPDPISKSAQAAVWARRVYALNENASVFVAGSTREPEERIVLDAYRRLRKSFPHTVLIIAPRHIERAGQIEQWVNEKGLICQRRSTLDGMGSQRIAPVVILDTIGELSDTYSVADFVFCGGSLVPKGGQNLLEPAAWGKPVMYGPSMEDFTDARHLIEAAGGGLTIHDADQMAAVATDWLNRPNFACSVGKAARRAVLSHRGAARKHAEVVVRLLDQVAQRQAAGFEA